MKKEISGLKVHYKSLKKEIKQRLRQFSALPASDYFYELCFCLLTPQSNAKKCWQAVEKLKKCRLEGRKINSRRIKSCLRQNTRFYRKKAKYIKEAVKKWPKIKEKITKIKDAAELRNWLADKDNVKGLGYKEASHFLRNIGKSQNKAAILDRHILRNLKRYGVVRKIPNLNKKNYLLIEKKMIAFSRKLGIPLDELDLLLWAKETGNVFK